MFHVDIMPPHLTDRPRITYVVDPERDVWLQALGSKGRIPHSVYQLSVHGARVPFEIDDNAKDGDVQVQLITTFGYSRTAQRSHGLAQYVFADSDHSRELQTLAAEAVLVFMTYRYLKFAVPADHLRVKLNAEAGGTVYSLADFGDDQEQVRWR